MTCRYWLLGSLVWAGCLGVNVDEQDAGGGPLVDAGVLFDAGSSTDAAVFLDAGAGRDSGAAGPDGGSSQGDFVDGGFGYPLPLPGYALALGASTADSVRPSSHNALNWQYSLFDSYGGGVLVPWYSSGGAYVIAGTGGHGAPENTGAALFDFTTGQWAFLPDATGSDARSSPYDVSETSGSPEYELATTGATPNSIPSPPHPYLNLVAVPPGRGGGSKGSVVYPVAAAQCAQSVISTRTHRFDLSSRTWSRFSANHVNDLSSHLAISSESPSVFDPVEGRIWQLPNQIHAARQIGFLDLTHSGSTPTWQLSTTWPYPPTWENTSTAWVDPARRLILLQSSKRLIALDLNDLSTGPHELSVSGTLPSQLNRWELYPEDGNFYTKGSTGSLIYRLTPPNSQPLTSTWSVTSFSPLGASLPSISSDALNSGSRHYSRFFYVPSIACFAWISTSTEPVTLIKPPKFP